MSKKMKHDEVVRLRLSQAQKIIIKKIAQSRGTTVSGIIREQIEILNNQTLVKA